MDSKLSRRFKSSVTVIDGDDLLLEILFRLPVKHLVRFKSVSKRWLSLISSPHFYRRLAGRNSGLLMTGHCNRQPYSSKIHFISLNGNPSMASPPPFKSVDSCEGTWWILQSCKGLLLCTTHKNQTMNYCILNPTTMQYFMLPPLTDIAGSCTHHSRDRAINLAFDPLKSPYYKVVSVRRIDSDDFESRKRYQIDIYSNENGIWRNSGNHFNVPHSMFFEDGVFSNGAIHWFGPLRFWIYFNVDEERLVIMPYLQLPVPSWRIMYFGESFGHLHLLDIDYSPTIIQFKVYELEKDNSNWFLKFNVDFDPIVNARKFRVLSIVREEDDDDECLLLLHIPGEIISYKFKDKSFRKLHDLPPCTCNDGGSGLKQPRCFNVYQYIETIACARSCT